MDINKYNFSAITQFNPEDVRFVLTTQQSNGEELKIDLETIKASNFDAKNPTRFTIHGWNAGPESGVNTLVTEQYLKNGNFNCIMVDWSKEAGKLTSVA